MYFVDIFIINIIYFCIESTSLTKLFLFIRSDFILIASFASFMQIFFNLSFGFGFPNKIFYFNKIGFSDY